MFCNPPVLIAFLGALSQAHPDTSRVEHQAVAMGSPLHMVISGPDRATAVAAIGDVLDHVEAVERMLSSWTTASEIGWFNREPAGVPVKISAELFAVLREITTWTRHAHGAFDPGVGALIDAWDLRGNGRTPDPEEIRAAREASGIERFTLNARTRSVTRPVPAAWIDAGGFGKGLALRRVRDALRARGIRSAKINFGGQVLVVGSETTGGSWVTHVADPADRARSVQSVYVRDMSVATTGQSQRSVVVNGEPIGHVVDPRTGYPVPDWGSVTVVARDPMEADILATSLLVLGREEGMAWGNQHDVAAIVVDITPTGARRIAMTEAAHQYVGSPRKGR